MSFLWGNTSQQPPEPKKFANISNDQINSNQQAVPVKYLAGRQYLAGDYITPAYNPKAVPIKTKTGKDESSTTGYKYFADFALLFCTGGRRPVDTVYKVIVDSDIRWDNSTGVSRTAGYDYEKIDVDDLGSIYLYWGSETQAIDSTLLSPRSTDIGGGNKQDKTTFPPRGKQGSETDATGLDGTKMASGDSDPFSGHYDQHPAYRGQCYAVFKNWKLGRDRTSVPNIQLELARGCPLWNNGQTPSPVDPKGVNPIAVLYDWLTDPRFGMGLPDTSLDIPSFIAAYNSLNTTGLKISPLITQQEDFRQAVAELLEYYDGWIRTNGTLIQVGVWSKGTIQSSATLTDDQMLAEPELEPQGWGPTVNELTVTYKDKDHHYNDYVQVYRDPNNFRITGGPRMETFQRPWITDASTAKAYAQVSGAAMALPFTRGTLHVKREWITNNNMMVGKVFTYNSGFYGLSFLMRLLEIEYAADNSASAALTAEWERSKWPSMYIPPKFQGPGGFVIGPRAIWQLKINEIPYLIEDQKFDTQVVTLAVRGNIEAQGYRIWLSLDGTTYQIVPHDSSTSSFSSYGKLDTALGNTNDDPKNITVNCHLFGIDLDEVVSQSVAEWRDDTLLCFIGTEVMSVGLVHAAGSGSYRIDLHRMRFGTAKTAHAVGSAMYFIYRKRWQLLDNAGFIAGTTIYLKLQPFTADLDYNITSLTPITYTIVGFGDIPAPVLSPAAGTFQTAVDVHASTPPATTTLRYTRNGTPVTGTSAKWPGSNVIHLTATTTIRARLYADDGRTSPELTATYTKIIGSVEPPVCAPPSWSFTGVLHHSGGNITLTPVTTGSTIHYDKGSGELTSTSPVTVSLAALEEGESIEFWATLAEFSASNHVVVDNTREQTSGGGGHWPPRNPP